MIPLARKRPGAPSLALGSNAPSMGSLSDIPAVEVGDAAKFEKSQFQTLQALGQGAGGAVRKVMHVPSQTIMAAKVHEFHLGGQTLLTGRGGDS